MTGTPLQLDHRIDCRPDFSLLTVQLPPGELLRVEASAMAAMDAHVQMRSRLSGGFGRMLTGESLFINEYTAEEAPGEIAIAPPIPGDLVHRQLTDETIYLQNSAFTAATGGIEVESKWQGLVKGFFSGESFFLIRCHGSGDLWFNSYGAILEADVVDRLVVDTGHIVAFTEGLDYRVTRLAGYKSLFFSGEGLVCRFEGEGKVWIQTRNVPALTAWINLFRRTKKKN